MRRPQPLAAALSVAALAFLAVGLWMAVQPAGFQAAVGGFGATNEHLVGDLATFNLALGGVLGIAAFRSSWRVPVLWFANVQNALHLANHLLDADQAQPLWLGMANVWALLATAAVLGVLLAASAWRTWFRPEPFPAQAGTGVPADLRRRQPRRPEPAGDRPPWRRGHGRQGRRTQ